MDASAVAGLVPYSGHCITCFTIRAERGIPDTQPVVDNLPPLFHVRKDAPPLLLFTGDRELELLGRYEENAYQWCSSSKPTAPRTHHDRCIAASLIEAWPGGPPATRRCTPGWARAGVRVGSWKASCSSRTRSVAMNRVGRGCCRALPERWAAWLGSSLAPPRTAWLGSSLAPPRTAWLGSSLAPPRMAWLGSSLAPAGEVQG